MAKLVDKAIGLDDFNEYLNTYSDFAFELSVRREVEKVTRHVEHGGLYAPASLANSIYESSTGAGIAVI